MAFFNFGKGKSGGSKKPAAKTKKKRAKKQRLISIKNLHLNPTIEDGLYKTLAEGVSNPDEPYISIATIDNEQFIYELALTDKLIHENGFDKGEPNIISQIKTGLALTGKHGNSVPKGLVNGSFFFDLDPEEGTEAQIVFVPTVGTLRRLEDLGGEDAKYQLVIIPADIDADNYDEYYQEGLINSPLQDDDGSGNRLVTIDEFKSLAEEGAGSPDLQENEGVAEDLDDDDVPPEPDDNDDFMSSGDDDLMSNDDDDLVGGNNDDLMSNDDDDLVGNSNDDLMSNDDDDLVGSNNDDLMSNDDDDLVGGNNDNLMSNDDDLVGGNMSSGDNDDDLISGNDDDFDLDGLTDDDESAAPAAPAQNDPLASNDDDFKLDTDDNLALPGDEDGDNGLDGFLDDDDDEDEFVGYDGQAEQGPTASDELSSKQDDFTVANSDEPEEVPDEEETTSNDDLDLDALDDDNDESTDDMFDDLNDGDDNWDDDEDEPSEPENGNEPSEAEDDGEPDEDDDWDDDEDKPDETDSDVEDEPTESDDSDADDDKPEPDEDDSDADDDKPEADEDDSDADDDKPEAKKEKKSSDSDSGEGDSESKPTAKDLGYVDTNKQNLDSFIRQNIIQLDNALDGLDARLFPIDAKHDNQSMIGYKTMYNSLLESQAKREKELIRTKFKHQLTQLLDPYVNHTTFSDNFPKIDAAFNEKLFDQTEIDAEKAAGQMQIEDRYKELHQKLIDDAIAKAEDDYTNNYEPVKAQEIEEASKAIDASRRQKYDQAVDRVLNKAFYLDEAKLSKEAQKITSRFIANDVAEANFELTNKAISYSEEMMRYMQFDKMIDARIGSTQKVDDSVMRQTIEDLQNRLNRQMEENKDSEKKIAALQSAINKAKTEPKPAAPAAPAKPEPVLDDSEDKVKAVVHDELKTGNELLAELKRAMVKDGRKKPAKEIIKAAELDDEPVNTPEK